MAWENQHHASKEESFQNLSALIGKLNVIRGQRKIDVWWAWQYYKILSVCDETRFDEMIWIFNRERYTTKLNHIL